MPRRPVLALLAPLLICFASSLPASADEFTEKLCAGLADVVPRVQGFRPEGVRAQLVMKIAGDFDYDPDALARVQDEGDAVTTASCPELRTQAIALAGTKTLGEALR
jgi:hypothetical protein